MTTATLRSRTKVKRNSLTAKLVGYFHAAYDHRGYEGAREAHLRAGRALTRRGLIGTSRYQIDVAMYQAAQRRFMARRWVG